MPNITGYLGAYLLNAGEAQGTGAFSKTIAPTPNLNGVYGAYNTGRTQLDFDASDSNPIYGNSTTVQPATCKTYFIIKY